MKRFIILISSQLLIGFKMQKYKFIINPIPLNKHKIEFLNNLKSIMQKNGISYSYEYTTKEKTAESIARNTIKEGYEIVVACGGDGTIREVINGMYGGNAGLGILPFGTSNDFAKHLGLDNIAKAQDRLFKENKRRISLGEVEFILNNEKKRTLFCSTSGIGFDAKMLRANESRLFLRLKKILGNLIYPLAGLFLVFGYESKEVEIDFGGKKIRTKLFMLNANFVKSMAGMKVTPNADVDNGVFDIFLVEDTNIFKKLVGLLWYGFTSKKIRFKEVNYISKNALGSNNYNLSDVKNFRINSKQNIEVQVNGDFIGFTPVRFRVLDNAMGILV